MVQQKRKEGADLSTLFAEAIDSTFSYTKAQMETQRRRVMRELHSNLLGKAEPVAEAAEAEGDVRILGKHLNIRNVTVVLRKVNY